MSADQFCFQIVELLSIYMELEEEKNPVSIYIVMKYCGENLVEYMRRRDVTLEDAAIIVYNIARGLNVWSSELCLVVPNLGGGGLQPKKPKTTANFKFGTGFFVSFWCFSFLFSVFPFRPILTGLTGSC